MKLNLAAIAAKANAGTQLPKPVVLAPTDKATESVVEAVVRATDAEIAATDSAIDGVHEPVVIEASEVNLSGDRKLSALIDNDFPFDETQLEAIEGISREKYACMTGAAGTGKTTTTKAIVERLLDGTSYVDMQTYWKKGLDKGADEGDEYEMPEDLIPSVLLCAFTGRATQMIKKNFPRDWHGNIMTIHRALGFMPEFYEDFDDESGDIKKKMRFIPTYNSELKMPWDVVVVDEAGMLGLDLWHQLLAACKESTRIIMIGDINQLPPTHGKSIFGFAMSEWPSWELTHVHRQQGANNSIVDNAHRILKGIMPISDCPDKKANLLNNEGALPALNFMAKDPNWRFAAFEVDADSRKASIMIRKIMKVMQGKLYEPNRDALITPINGFESTATGYMLGQEPLNRELAVTLNAGQERYLIDGGRDRKNFAIGDKVMATRNDYETGITNGMTGIIESIARHGGYQGEPRRWGLISEVQNYLNELGADDDTEDFSLEELSQQHEELDEGAEQKKEGRDRGPASHIVTVKFGEGEHAFSIPFQSQAEVASLQLAYAMTCHKMQGGEAPLVAVICHQSHKRPLNREWLYTAVTRASHRCIIFYTRQGMAFALTKQNIKGSTLKQKVQSFQELQKVGILGAAVKVTIPKSDSKGMGSLDLMRPESKIPGEAERALMIQNAIQGSVARPKARVLEGEEIRKPAPAPTREEVHIHLHVQPTKIIRERVETPVPTPPKQPVDGGELKPNREAEVNKAVDAITARMNRLRQEAADRLVARTPTPALPAPAKLTSQWGAVQMAKKLEAASEIRLLGGPTEVQVLPIPKGIEESAALIEEVKSEIRKVNPLAALLAKQRAK